MRLLILGGIAFLGRALVDAALAHEHSVTLFNRGQTHPGLYPEVEHLRENRDGGLEALQGQSWDAVIDTCGFVPRIARQSAELLQDAVGHYTFTSSISVYADFSRSTGTKPGQSAGWRTRPWKSSTGIHTDPSRRFARLKRRSNYRIAASSFARVSSSVPMTRRIVSPTGHIASHMVGGCWHRGIRRAP